jgi:uncharacterized protein
LGEEHPLAGGDPARQRSIPASILTLFVLWQLDLSGESSRSLVNLVLCFALILTATSLLFRKAILEHYRWRLQQLDPGAAARATVLVGATLGVLVSISSVGAGAVGVTALLLLYPQLPMTRIVGSDIAHAVPLPLLLGWDTGRPARSTGTLWAYCWWVPCPAL